MPYYRKAFRCDPPYILTAQLPHLFRMQQYAASHPSFRIQTRVKRSGGWSSSPIPHPSSTSGNNSSDVSSWCGLEHLAPWRHIRDDATVGDGEVVAGTEITLVLAIDQTIAIPHAVTEPLLLMCSFQSHIEIGYGSVPSQSGGYGR